MKNPWRELSKVNPQRKPNRQINNDCYHALMVARLPGAVYQVILTVIDKTWGFDKQGARISIGEFQKATGLSRQSVCSAIKQAEQLRIIIVARNSTKVSEYMFNKHWDTWLASQAYHPSDGEELVKYITLAGKPNWSSKSHQSSQANHPSASQAATPRTEPVQKPLKETSKERGIIKKEYGEFNNVLLSDEEYRKLEVRFGGTLKDRIEKLSCGIEGKGYKYISHYATILSWSRSERDFHPVPKPSKPVPSYQEPDKYIKGKYGHVVRRD